MKIVGEGETQKKKTRKQTKTEKKQSETEAIVKGVRAE